MIDYYFHVFLFVIMIYDFNFLVYYHDNIEIFMMSFNIIFEDTLRHIGFILRFYSFYLINQYCISYNSIFIILKNMLL